MDLPRTIGLMGPPPRPGGRPGVSVIRPVLLVGEYPVPEDAAWLCDQHGVTAVLSLQDDADLASKGIEIRALERAYREHGLVFHRIPVPDGDDRHLAARLGDIVALLDRLTDAGECVYLHCNAGLNRAKGCRSRRRATRSSERGTASPTCAHCTTISAVPGSRPRISRATPGRRGCRR